MGGKSQRVPPDLSGVEARSYVRGSRHSATKTSALNHLRSPLSDGVERATSKSAQAARRMATRSRAQRFPYGPAAHEQRSIRALIRNVRGVRGSSRERWSARALRDVAFTSGAHGLGRTAHSTPRSEPSPWCSVTCGRRSAPGEAQHPVLAAEDLQHAADRGPVLALEHIAQRASPQHLGFVPQPAAQQRSRSSRATGQQQELASALPELSPEAADELVATKDAPIHQRRRQVQRRWLGRRAGSY